MKLWCDNAENMFVCVKVVAVIRICGLAVALLKLSAAAELQYEVIRLRVKLPETV